MLGLEAAVSETVESVTLERRDDICRSSPRVTHRLWTQLDRSRFVTDGRWHWTFRSLHNVTDTHRSSTDEPCTRRVTFSVTIQQLLSTKLLLNSTSSQTLLASHAHRYYYIRLTAFLSRTTWVSQHQKGKPFWILVKQDMMGWQWHQLDHTQLICTSLQTDNHASTSSLTVYRPDALPAGQPTASKHWRHPTASKHWRYRQKQCQIIHERWACYTAQSNTPTLCWKSNSSTGPYRTPERGFNMFIFHIYIYWFDNGLTTSWPSWRTRSTTPPPRSTSAVTSSLSPSLVGFALLLRHESANRLPGPTSPTVLFAAPLLLFGIH